MSGASAPRCVARSVVGKTRRSESWGLHACLRASQYHARIRRGVVCLSRPARCLRAPHRAMAARPCSGQRGRSARRWPLCVRCGAEAAQAAVGRRGERIRKRSPVHGASTGGPVRVLGAHPSLRASRPGRERACRPRCVSASGRLGLRRRRDRSRDATAGAPVSLSARMRAQRSREACGLVRAESNEGSHRRCRRPHRFASRSLPDDCRA